MTRPSAVSGRQARPCARDGEELRGLHHGPPPRRGRGAERGAGARPGVLEQVAEAHDRVVHHGEGAEGDELGRAHRRGQEQEQEKEAAHGRGSRQRSRVSVESISSLAVMTLEFISYARCAVISA
jgi:hypothetical protein